MGLKKRIADWLEWTSEATGEKFKETSWVWGIVEWLNGVRKTVDERLTRDNIVKLLQDLDNSTKCNVEYLRFHPGMGVRFKPHPSIYNASPEDVVKLLEDKFTEQDGYIRGHHKVYSGHGCERHYLRLNDRDTCYKHAEIEFEIKKD